MVGKMAKRTTDSALELTVTQEMGLAQFWAYALSMGPMAFMVIYTLLEHDVLTRLREHSEGCTAEGLADELGGSLYAVTQLLRAACALGILNMDEQKVYTLTRVGWLIESDPQVRANVRFTYDINYRGFYHMPQSLAYGRPEGLQTLGSWSSIYEGLSALKTHEKASWLHFDHRYSDLAFGNVLDILFPAEALRDSRPLRLLDIGGNTGRWALRCTQRHPSIEVTIADLPGQIALLNEQLADHPDRERINGYPIDILDPSAPLPQGPFDIIWMSQFLDCFSGEEVISILSRLRPLLRRETQVYILEPLVDRQQNGTARMTLSLMSLYFTVMANGNSGFFAEEELREYIRQAGLRIEEIHHGLGIGHSLLRLSRE